MARKAWRLSPANTVVTHQFKGRGFAPRKSNCVTPHTDLLVPNRDQPKRDVDETQPGAQSGGQHRC